MDVAARGSIPQRACRFTESELDAASRGSYFKQCLTERDDRGRVYDAVYHIQQDYEPRVSRDDKAISLKLNVNKEERERRVPVRSSSWYGWYKNTTLEQPQKKNVRVQLLNKGLFRSHGIGIPLETELSELDDKSKPQ